MACTTLKLINPVLSSNHDTFSKTTLPMSHSFRQVSFPKKSQICSSVSSSSASVLVPLVDLIPVGVGVSSTTTINAAAAAAAGGLCGFWREIHGCNNWDGLVEPTLNPLLRQEIIRYGEFAAACYKAFDLNPNSKRYLTCKFGKNNFFKQVGLENSGYKVSKYIYATPPGGINIPIPIPNQNYSESGCGRWIGYVAVSSDEMSKKIGRRDVLISFRGTVTNPEWVTNLMSSLTPARLDPHDLKPDVKVESGFLSLYTSQESNGVKFGLESCREQLLSEMSRLLNEYKNEEMSITMGGHSMGSALAVLLAYDISELGLNVRKKRNEEKEIVPVSVFSFGGPRVGNSSFKQRCEELGVKVLRIANVNDPITKMPGFFFNENFRIFGGNGNNNNNNINSFPWPWLMNLSSYSCYEHVGVELLLDFFNMQNPSCVHDLETYINLLRCPKPEEDLRHHHLVNHHLHHHQVIQIHQKNNKAQDFISRAMEFFSTNAQNLNMIPWRNAASNMVNYFGQSQIN